MSDRPPVDVETRTTLVWTVGSAAAFGLAFIGVPGVRAAAAGTDLLAVWQPLLALGVIGATTGGLLGPLIMRAVLRRRDR